MRLSVIVATFNRLQLLKETLPLLFRQDLAEDHEIILVDDGSKDGTRDFLEGLRHYHPNLTVLHHPVNQGQASAINTGILSARGEVLLFLDDDIEVQPNLFSRHLAAHHIPNLMVFGPVLVSPRQPDSIIKDWTKGFCDEFFTRYETQSESMRSRGWYFAFANANTSIHREVLQKYGMLLPELIRGNDLEFGFRLHSHGVKFHFLKEAAVHQLGGKTSVEAILTDARDEAEAEMTICRRQPRYRAHSRLLSFASGGWWRRKLRELIVRLPFSIVPLFSILFSICDRLSWMQFIRRAGKRAIWLMTGIIFFRRAIELCGTFGRFKHEFGECLPVLLYHHVGPPVPGSFSSLTLGTDEFEKQMSWLKRKGYNTILSKQWADWVAEGKPLPAKPVAIHFDDAYLDNCDNAYPVLARTGMNATIFVVAGLVGKTNEWDQRNGYTRMQLMDQDLIRRWQSAGFEIASHSFSHADLTSLPDRELADDANRSQSALRERLGQEVSSFAYPYGYWNDRVADACASVYRHCFTCEEGLNDGTVLFDRLRRTNVAAGFSWLDPWSRVTFGFNPLQRLRLYLGLARRRFLWPGEYWRLRSERDA